MAGTAGWYEDDPELRGAGVEQAWAAAVAALPRDAWIYSLTTEVFAGETRPAGWIANAHCERKGWTREYVGRGDTPAAALRAMADWCRKYAVADRDPAAGPTPRGTQE